MCVFLCVCGLRIDQADHQQSKNKTTCPPNTPLSNRLVLLRFVDETAVFGFKNIHLNNCYSLLFALDSSVRSEDVNKHRYI